ncbi:phosphoglycolate phosphatase [Arcanobacterium pluranimalium]|uniref:HAD hydrolase-like protein n=1 Tax=Arcanobacterium pluranimalium TaxID=108028 RepID=UPI00195D026C|nr:HAD hydrolase-like protein [Arcanobacterium pluranimalium]MBM7825559.1 phosphoglycolate phosphatase [Arcanobacterium pluranimalium]
MNELKAVLFDLDGTLTDSAPLICNALHETMLEKAGVDMPPASFMPCVGPPLHQSFARMGVAQDQIEDYIADYRHRYLQVMDQTPLFPGMGRTLRVIKEELGVPLLVATSKLTHLAQEVCDNLDISSVFSRICGAHTDTMHSSKTLVVADALQYLYDAGVLAQAPDVAARPHVPDNGEAMRTDVVMVGDRIFDIEGAGAHNIRTVLVQWGGAPQSEHDLAWASVKSQEELIRVLCSLKG